MIPYFVDEQDGTQVIPTFIYDGTDGFYRISDWTVVPFATVAHAGLQSADELVTALCKVFPCLGKKYFRALVSAIVLTAAELPDGIRVVPLRLEDRYNLSIPEKQEFKQLITYKELTS